MPRNRKRGNGKGVILSRNGGQGAISFVKSGSGPYTACSSSFESAPYGNAIVRPKPMSVWSWDAAPAHDLYPHGGLRIRGTLPAANALYNDTVALGGWATSGLAGAGVHPAGAVVTGQTEALFLSTGPLAVFSQFFRHFRFRKLRVSTTSAISVSDTTDSQKTVQLAFEPDIVTASQTAYSSVDAAVTETCVRFPAWIPKVDFDAIDEKTHDPADELFFTSAAADSIAAAGDAEIRQCFQGAVTVVMLSVHATADVNFATVLLDFEVDLYGFTNIATGVLPLEFLMRKALSIDSFERTPGETDEQKRIELRRQLALLDRK